jgi:hypothetical protein
MTKEKGWMTRPWEFGSSAKPATDRIIIPLEDEGCVPED